MFGSTVTTRPQEIPGVEGSIGLYMNTIPLRAKLDPNAETAEWLREMQASHAEDREHGHTALSEIQRWTGFGAGRDLFETLVSYEGFPESVAKQRQERTFTVSGESLVEHSNYPLALLVVPEKQISLILVFDKARFGPEAVERMAAHLETALAAIAADVSAPVSSIPLLTEQEGAAATRRLEPPRRAGARGQRRSGALSRSRQDEAGPSGDPRGGPDHRPMPSWRGKPSDSQDGCARSDRRRTRIS